MKSGMQEENSVCVFGDFFFFFPKENSGLTHTLLSMSPVHDIFKELICFFSAFFLKKMFIYI